MTMNDNQTFTVIFAPDPDTDGTDEYFTCQASDAEDARSQAEAAFPEKQILWVDIGEAS